MKIVIVGAGALGSLFGALLTEASAEGKIDADVWLYNPSFLAHIERLRREGLILETPKGTRRVRVQAASSLEEIGAGADAEVEVEVAVEVDYLGLFVKAYDTQAALRGALPLVGEGTAVFSLQNGTGNTEAMARHLPPERVLRGTTAQGATLVEPGRVRWAGCGPTRLGPIEPHSEVARQKAQALIEAFNRAGIASAYHTPIEPLVWEKLLINAAINPLTALMDVDNGVLVEDPHLRRVLQAVVREGVAVAQAKGFAFEAASLTAKVEEVCRLTAANVSSMRQDARRGKRTEIEQINGAIVREGKRLGMDTPLNRLLVRLVEGKASPEEARNEIKEVCP